MKKQLFSNIKMTIFGYYILHLSTVDHWMSGGISTKVNARNIHSGMRAFDLSNRESILFCGNKFYIRKLNYL